MPDDDFMTEEEFNELMASHPDFYICPHCGEEVDYAEADELADKLGRDVCPHCLE